MIRLRDIATLLVTGMFAGCSPVVDRSNSPDASIDAADTAGPTLVRSDPANMGTRFSVIQPITLTFDEPLDPASISTTTIKLAVDEQILTHLQLDSDILKTTGAHSAPKTQVRGTVSYDATSRTIAFTPVRPLNYGQRHTLSVSVKDVRGNTAEQTLNFLTFVNGVTRETRFNASPNTVSGITLYAPDMNGFIEKHLNMNPGGDAQWFTSDDAVGSFIRLTHDASGRLTHETPMNPGTDGILNTPDDTIQQLIRYIYDPMGYPSERVLFNGGPGPDTVYNTPDDPITYLFAYAHAGGTPGGYVWYISPGTDTLWRTPDDRCTGFWDFTFDASGNKTREVLKSCSTDNLPRTADDTFAQVKDYTWNANNELTHEGRRNGPGTDAAWLTPDDSHSIVTRFERDASGLVTATFTYGGPGTDLVWNTSDDVVASYSRHTYTTDTKQLIEIKLFNDDGVDNVFGTQDDVQLQYTTFSYDALGNRTDQKVVRAGDDNVFYTADDRVVNDFDYDTTH